MSDTMAGEAAHGDGTLKAGSLAIILALAGAGIFALLKDVGVIAVAAGVAAITELLVAACIFVAAGGWGYLLVGRLMPASAPRGLRVLTAVLVGAWLSSTLLLTVGSVASGAFSSWLWWLFVAAGIAAAAWQARGCISKFKFAGACSAWSLVWIGAALAAGIWLAGATVPPGELGGTDAYDILEYHLQVPREYLHAGQITPLEHNCYSFYPMGVEMLFMLGMILRGGAYEGMYLASVIHGSFAVIAVAAVYLSLRRDEPARGRFAAVLLAGVPFIVYLSWLAMVELAIVAHLALALLWLREWSREHCWRSAVCIGAMIGGACAVKYLSVGFVVAPIIAAMLACCVRKWRRAGHVAMAAAVAGVLWSPWLIRNTVTTGNPVFPLATSIFGRGHWDAQSEQRWADGHAPGHKPPVPMPRVLLGDSERPGRLENFVSNFLTSDMLGAGMLLLAAAGICTMIASKRSVPEWEWMLVGVAGVQLALWAAFTRDMPSRFIMPVVVPLSLLAGGVLARLSLMRANPFRKGAATTAHGKWGASAAAILLILVMITNTLNSLEIFVGPSEVRPLSAPVSIDQLMWNTGLEAAGNTLPKRLVGDAGRPPKLMLVGEARGFYMPIGTLYATVFDVHPIDKMLRSVPKLSPAEIRSRLRDMGVTHVLAHWSEILRLARTYGYPASLVEGFFTPDSDGLAPPPGQSAFDKIGLRVVGHLNQAHRSGQKPVEPFTRQTTHRTYATLFAVGDE